MKTMLLVVSLETLALFGFLAASAEEHVFPESVWQVGWFGALLGAAWVGHRIVRDILGFHRESYERMLQMQGELIKALLERRGDL